MIIPALPPPHSKLIEQGPFAKPVAQVYASIFPSGTNLVNAVLYSNEQGGQLNKMDVDWIDFHYKKTKKANTNCISAQFLRRTIYTNIKKCDISNEKNRKQIPHWRKEGPTCFFIRSLFPVHKLSGGSAKAHKIAALPRANLELIEVKSQEKKEEKKHNSTLFYSLLFIFLLLFWRSLITQQRAPK